MINVYSLLLPYEKDSLMIYKILVGIVNISDMPGDKYCLELISQNIHLSILQIQNWTIPLITQTIRALGNMSYYNKSYFPTRQLSICEVFFYNDDRKWLNTDFLN